MRIIQLAVAVAVCLNLLQTVPEAWGDTDESNRPNMLIILADDLGYGDLGCYGGTDLKTPRIDAFAAANLRLTDCYAAHPNCSPSRAGMMTGRTPFRVGIYNWIPMFSPVHVKRTEITIATLLRNSGYDTCHVGKWHLNGDFNLPTQPQPIEHGFDHWFSTQNNALPNHRNPDNFVRNGTPVGPLQGYSAQLVATEGQAWLRSGRDPNKPFFLFACFHEPHEPIASAKQFTDLYPSDDPGYSAHHGNISQLDAGVGALLDCLDELKLADNTFVFVTSDNGPAITGMHPHGSAGPLRDKKGAIYDGGIRVPGIIRWPDHTKRGTTSTEPISGIDVLPTLCELAGVAPPTDRIIDGTSMLPALEGRPLSRERPLYWQFNRARADAKVAIRDGDWKLVASLDTPDPTPSGGIAKEEMRLIKTARLSNLRLYNLRSDIAESTDVSAEHTDVFTAMSATLQQLYGEVQTAAPHWPAWEWPRHESTLIQWPEYWLNRKRNK
ncbi:MAG: sulfatase-like hydrolase/transferase [Fuerstiella sp.]|nr:sulfatase-like hydrolase/transferase [Fuerstiella sp.]MCP4853200.1 sulfatase-like hydrolase/transferase [Fuerstiella sp.]